MDSRDDLSRAHTPSVRNHPPYSLPLVRTAVVKPRVHRPQFYLSHSSIRYSSYESEGPVFAFKIAFQYCLMSHGHPCRKGQVHGVYAPMGILLKNQGPLARIQYSLTSTTSFLHRPGIFGHVRCATHSRILTSSHGCRSLSYRQELHRLGQAASAPVAITSPAALVGCCLLRGVRVRCEP